LAVSLTSKAFDSGDFVTDGDGGSAAVASDTVCAAMEQFAEHDFNAQKWRREKFWTEKVREWMVFCFCCAVCTT
jgi:hypothetical protein